MSNRIKVPHVEEYAALVAALTKENLAFNGGYDADGWWIEITGF